MIRLIAGNTPSGRALAVKIEPFPDVVPEKVEKGLTAADLRVAFGLAFPAHVQCIRKIQDTVAEFYGINSKYMRQADGKGAREALVSHPRQVAMFFARKFTNQPLTDIGRRFKRDHSTVIHAVRAVEKRASEDPLLEMELEVLRERLGR